MNYEPKIGDLVRNNYGSKKFAVITRVEGIGLSLRVVSHQYPKYRCYGIWCPTKEGAIHAYAAKVGVASVKDLGFEYATTLDFIQKISQQPQQTIVCNCNVWITGCKCGVFKKEAKIL